MRSFLASAAVLCATGILGCSNARQRTATVPPPPAQPQISGKAQTALPESGIIPAGTTVAIRTGQEIRSPQPGQTFAAEVEQDILDQSGRSLIPRGSPVELTVVQTSEAGTAETPEMELAIQSVSIGGEKYAVATASTGEQGLRAGRAASETGGAGGTEGEGGALLGTLIGASVTNSQQTGSASAAPQVLTRGERVEAPAGIVLSFRLEQPWHLNAIQQ